MKNWTIRTTTRARERITERAKSRQMSVGEYLDWMSQQSAVKNDLATPITAESTPIRTQEYPPAPIAEEPASSTPQSAAIPAQRATNPTPKGKKDSICPKSPDRTHKWGGVGASGLIRRCQACQVRLLPSGDLIQPNPVPSESPD